MNVIRLYTADRKKTPTRSSFHCKERTDVSYFKLRSSIEQNDVIKTSVTSCEYQVYNPSSDYEDEEVEIFYEELEEMMVKVHRKDLLIVNGDWNAIVGNTNDVDRYAVGKFALGKTNPRGLRLLEFASKHRFTIANTLHPQKNLRKSTWHSPNGLFHNQIDYILILQWFKSSIQKASTRTYPGAEINSDHDLVLCNMREHK